MFQFTENLTGRAGLKVGRSWLRWFRSQGIPAGLVEHPDGEKFVYRIGFRHDGPTRRSKPTGLDIPPLGSRLLNHVEDFHEFFQDVVEKHWN